MLEQLQKLYGHDKKGGVKVWWVEVDGAVITTHYGALDGAITTETSPPCIGKQKRNNEEQAEFEALSKWNKKKDDSYAITVESIPTSRKPPLAKKYYEHVNKFKPGYLASAKLNGVNCSIYLDQDESVFFQSRGDKPYPVIGAIARELDLKLFTKYPDATVVGEMYVHGTWLEDITSYTKRTQEGSNDLQFHIFEVCFPHAPDMPFKARMELLEELWESSPYDANDRTFLLNQNRMESEEQFDEFHVYCKDEGYEGSVIRDPESVFTFKSRDVNYLKRKDELDAEFQVIGFEQDKKGGGVPVCLLPDVRPTNSMTTDFDACNTENRKKALAYFNEHGNWAKATEKHGVFKANKKGSSKTGARDEQKYMWEHQGEFIGKWLNVEFESFSKKGVPMKPIGKYFRECSVFGEPLE